MGGSYDRYSGAIRLSGPLGTERLRYLVGYQQLDQNEGYFKNANGGHDEGGVTSEGLWTAQLAFDITDNMDIWAKWGGSWYTQYRRTVVVPIPFNTTTAGTGLYINPLYSGAGASPAYTEVNLAAPPTNDLWHFRTNTPFKADLTDSQGGALEFNWRMGWADLKYIGGYVQYNYEQNTDSEGADRGPWTYTDPAGTASFRMPGSFLAQYIEDKRWMSHEINLSSPGDQRVQWIGGLYYFKEDDWQVWANTRANLDQGPYGRINADGSIGPNPFLNPVLNPFNSPTVASNPVQGRANPSGAAIWMYNDIETISKGAFLQIDTHVTDAWTLTTGVRWNSDEKAGYETARYVGFRPDTYSAFIGYQGADFSPLGSCAVMAQYDVGCSANQNSRQLEVEFEEYSGTVGVQWQPSSDNLLYLRWSKGYKAGGFLLGSNVALDQYVKPEYLYAWEGGWKTTFGGRLQVNTSVFNYDYRNQQVNLWVLNPDTNVLTQRPVGIEKLSQLGAEVELNWAATDALSINATYGYLDGEIDHHSALVENPVTGVAVPLDGGPIIMAPPNKALLNISYRFDIAGGTLVPSISGMYRDVTYGWMFRESVYRSPAYMTGNARLIWTGANNRYSVTGWVQNVTDERVNEYATYGEDTAGNIYPYGVRVPPRTWGVELQYRFGG